MEPNSLFFNVIYFILFQFLRILQSHSISVNILFNIYHGHFLGCSSFSEEFKFMHLAAQLLKYLKYLKLELFALKPNLSYPANLPAYFSILIAVYLSIYLSIYISIYL